MVQQLVQLCGLNMIYPAVLGAFPAQNWGPLFLPAQDSSRQPTAQTRCPKTLSSKGIADPEGPNPSTICYSQWPWPPGSSEILRHVSTVVLNPSDCSWLFLRQLLIATQDTSIVGPIIWRSLLKGSSPPCDPGKKAREPEAPICGSESHISYHPEPPAEGNTCSGELYNIQKVQLTGRGNPSSSPHSFTPRSRECQGWKGSHPVLTLNGSSWKDWWTPGKYRNRAGSRCCWLWEHSGASSLRR